jgi:pyridinium-3,5-biscarboxylic acid mononucleotide sulfurtransferase
MTVDRRLGRLGDVIEDVGSMVVAFSGGADSALLAWSATAVLGVERALCATAVSPSLSPEALGDCRALADEWGLRFAEVPTDELDDPSYVRNDVRRCYHCKSSLLDALVPLATAESATVVLGVNVDDLSDQRPGQQAAAERGARFPLVEAALTKDDVRRLSRQVGLRTWDKPASACLASRLPHGTPVTVERLGVVAAAESAVRALGFGQLRVRHYGELARIELDPAELPLAVDRRAELVAAVRGVGYRFVTLDLEGFRSGSLNAPPSGPADVEGGRA